MNDPVETLRKEQSVMIASICAYSFTPTSLCSHNRFTEMLVVRQTVFFFIAIRNEFGECCRQVFELQSRVHSSHLCLCP